MADYVPSLSDVLSAYPVVWSDNGFRCPEFAKAVQDSIKTRFAKIALETKGVFSSEIHSLTNYLIDLNATRMATKGKEMSDDHLRQEAVRLIREMIRQEVDALSVNASRQGGTNEEA